MKTSIMQKSQIQWAGRNFGPAVKSIKSTLALLCAAATLTARAGTDNRAPEVPETIAVPKGNKVHFHGFGVGFQVYTWNGTSWGNAVPDALLFNGQNAVV